MSDTKSEFKKRVSFLVGFCISKDSDGYILTQIYRILNFKYKYVICMQKRLDEPNPEVYVAQYGQRVRGKTLLPYIQRWATDEITFEQFKLSLESRIPENWQWADKGIVEV